MFLLEHAQDFFRSQSAAQPGLRRFQPPIVKTLRKLTPKIQAFERVFDLTLSIRGVEGARQFNSFNEFWILAIYCGHSFGFKNVQKVIEMALKLLFFPAKSQKSPSGWGLYPQTPTVMRLSCISLFSTGPKLDNFCGKKFTLGLSPLPLSHRRSQDFWLGGAQTTNHMQWRHQKFSKKELFVGQRYHRMEDLKP